MAVGYNLISCDDIIYPSLFQRHRVDLSTQVGNIVEFGDNGQYYTVEKNNQVVIPYPYDPLLYASVYLLLTSVKVNGQELINSATGYTYPGASYPYTGFLGAASIPSAFPADYPSGQNVSTAYTPGSVAPRALPDFIQAIINASGVQGIYFVAADPAYAARTSGLRLETFSNIIIHKAVSQTVEVEFETTLSQVAGPDVVNSHRIVFSGSTATYQVDGITVVPTIGTTVQDFVTEEKPVYLYAAPTEEITVQEDCPCDSCGECFNLTNCETGEIMQTTTNLTEYLSSVVTLEGYDGCWTVSNCSPKVAVVVEDEFVSCKSCLPNCNTPTC